MPNRDTVTFSPELPSVGLGALRENARLRKHSTLFHCLKRKVHFEPLGSRAQSLSFLSLHNVDSFALCEVDLFVSLSLKKKNFHREIQ